MRNLIDPRVVGAGNVSSDAACGRDGRDERPAPRGALETEIAYQDRIG